MLIRFAQPEEVRLICFKRMHVPTKKVVTLWFSLEDFKMMGEQRHPEGMPASKALQFVNAMNSYPYHRYRYWLEG